MGAPLAYYNEIDPLAAATIREAIKAGVIAPGVVDERDIRDLRPTDLAGYTQVHLFAGGGIWSYALRRAGWPDDRPIWTASCPCQPFSSAGKGDGFADERHLWPAAEWLIAQCRPVVIAGEQVADKGADPWVDLVQADLESMGYAFGSVPLASAGFGAPNIRHRNFWLAYAAGLGCEGIGGSGEDRTAERSGTLWMEHAGRASDEHLCGPGEALRAIGTAEGETQQRERRGATDRHTGTASRLAYPQDLGHERAGSARGWRNGPSDGGDAVGLAEVPLYTAMCCERCGHFDRPSAYSFHTWECEACRHWHDVRRPIERRAFPGPRPADCDPGPVNGFWRNADWLLCRDPGGPRWRPVDAGTFPLAPGHSSRVGGLRISGNAINAEVATAFIEAVIDVLRQPQQHLPDNHVEAAAGSADGGVGFHGGANTHHIGGNHA